jgi:Tfp pilus assembly protein PilZ
MLRETMSERRRAKRFPRRLRTQFGEKNGRPFSHTGLTSDVSSTGMFINTTANLKPGTRIHAEVALTEKQSLYVEGVITRQVIIPPELRTVTRAGLGMRFLTGSDLLGELVPVLKERMQVTLVYPAQAQLKEAWDKELKKGGGFVWLERALAVNSTVLVELQLPFAGTNLSFEARVVHVATERPNRHGIAFMFADAPGVAQALAPYLA